VPVYAYVAGPDLFYPNYQEVRAEKLALCRGFGFIGVPNDEFPGPVPPITSDKYIYEENLKLLDMCEVVLANLSAFRGAEPDAGTVWECVYGFAKGKGVYAYYNFPTMIKATEIMYPPVTWRDVEQADGSVVSTPFDKNDARIENWGKMVNLMLTNSIYTIYGTFRDIVSKAAADYGTLEKN
jgi:nucleoside 2-deoxyribosyltransferase